MVTFVHFNITGHCKGIFLLKGENGAYFEVKDDLYLGENHRFLAGMDLSGPLNRLAHLFGRSRHELPYLTYEWDAKRGVGFVRNHLPGGRQLLTSFSRFKLDGEGQSAGLFVGGSLPAQAMTEDDRKINQSGMAYFNGERWFHIWCNANEAIKSQRTARNYYPSQWKFLGSSVLKASDTEVTISSRHEVVIDNVPLHIERIADFKAGQPFFILSFRIENTGREPARFFYYYGDEPWLGNYGTSGGNVGWVKNRLVKYVSIIDTRKYTYAGFFDCGNDAIGEGHNFTRTANFLEWESALNTIVYYANDPGENILDKLDKEPLQGASRTMFIQWGPSNLPPGGTDYYLLAVGMANTDPRTGFPVKPATFATLTPAEPDVSRKN